MANVMFKRGLHSALPTGTNIKDGVFYLTTDTNRLYIGQQLQTSDTPQLIELNKSITVIDSPSDLPQTTTDNSKRIKGNQVAEGQFYYIKAGADSLSGNILAVCAKITGSNISWVQVNPDTDNGFNYNASGAFSTGVKAADNSSVTYTLTINAKHRPGGATDDQSDLSSGFDGAQIQVPLTITASDIGGILTAVSVGVQGTLSGTDNDTLTIATTGDNADSSKKVVLKAGENVHFKNVSGGIEVSATDTQYSLSFAGTANSGNTDGTASISFAEDGANQTSVNFAAGDKLNVSGNTANKTVTYSHETIAQATATNGGAATVTAGDEVETFTVVDSIATDGYGHTTGYTTKNVTVHDHQYKAGTISAKANGGLEFTITNSDGTASTTSTNGDNILYHTIKVWDSASQSPAPTVQTKYNQSDLGEFYSKTAIDNLMKDLNAMTYKGTVGGSNATVSTLPTTAASGDTYFVNDSITLPGGDVAKQGDLLIASGEETNGVIPANKLTWTHVESGKDADTTYTFDVADNSLKVTTHVGADSSQATELTIAGGTAISASTSGDTITLTHDDIANANSVIGSAANATKEVGANGSNATKTLSYNDTFIVPKVTVNKQGHVVALGETTIKLPDSDDTTYTLDTTTADSVAKLRLLDNDNAPATTISINGDPNVISVTAGTQALTITHADVLGSAKTDMGKNTSSLTAGGTLIVPQLNVTAEGHISAITNQELTLPSDTTYTLEDAAITAVADATNGNGVEAKFALLENGSSDAPDYASLKLRSKSLTISTPATSVAQVEIEWGTF